MSKRFRQQALLEIVSDRRIPNQAVLIEELKKLDFTVTQATVSRDIAELNLLKSPRGYTCQADNRKAVPTPVVDAKQLLRMLVLKVDVVLCFAVVRTLTSSAPQVALLIDQTSLVEVVGTIAGDDTVLVITGSPMEATKFKDILLYKIDGGGSSDELE